jgi:hypothetical protein
MIGAFRSSVGGKNRSVSYSDVIQTGSGIVVVSGIAYSLW